MYTNKNKPFPFASREYELPNWPQFQQGSLISLKIYWTNIGLWFKSFHKYFVDYLLSFTISNIWIWLCLPHPMTYSGVVIVNCTSADYFNKIMSYLQCTFYRPIWQTARFKLVLMPNGFLMGAQRVSRREHKTQIDS